MTTALFGEWIMTTVKKRLVTFKELQASGFLTVASTCSALKFTDRSHCGSISADAGWCGAERDRGVRRGSETGTTVPTTADSLLTEQTPRPPKRGGFYPPCVKGPLSGGKVRFAPMGVIQTSWLTPPERTYVMHGDGAREG